MEQTLETLVKTFQDLFANIEQDTKSDAQLELLQASFQRD